MNTSCDQSEAAEHDGRQRLLRAAERLIATEGFDVPSREIIAAAGHRNKSAIQYYFGSREELIQAIWYAHSAPVNLHRAELLAQLPPPGKASTRQLVDAYLLPIADELRSYTPSYWARFNERQLLRSPLHFVDDLQIELVMRDNAHPLYVLLLLYKRTEQHLTQLSREEAVHRVAIVFRLVMHGLATWERDAEDASTATMELSEFVDDLARLAVQMLEAPSRPTASDARDKQVDAYGTMKR